MDFIDILPFIMFAAHIIDKWYLSKGALLVSYIMTLFGSTATITYNAMMIKEMNGNHKSMLLFALTSVWAISMSIKGLLRLHKEGLAVRSKV